MYVRIDMHVCLSEGLINLTVHGVRGCTLLLLLGQLTLPFCMCDPGERYLSSPFAFTCEPALLLFAKAAFGLLAYIITFKTAALYKDLPYIVYMNNNP